MLRLSLTQVNAWRLSKQHLAERAKKDQLTRVVGDICGIQSQVLSSASLAIWARVGGVPEKDVQDAIWKHRSLVKTWAMRGTLHLLASSDLPLYVAALKTRINDMKEGMLKNHQVSPDEMEQVLSGIRNSLDRCCLTRAQLANKVASQSGLTPKLRQLMLSGWGVLLQPAAYRGILCFGPSQGPNVTFVRADQWLGKWDELSGEEALRRLASRFVAAYGPVTPRDFLHWWGGPSEKAITITESIADDLEEVEFEGRRSWLRKRDVQEIQAVRPVHSVRLLPSWDCYVMFYHPRELFVSTGFRSRIFRQLQGNAPVLLVDGMAAGVWERRKRGKRLEIRIDPFQPLSSEERSLVREEASSLGEFLGLTPQVNISK